MTRQQTLPMKTSGVQHLVDRTYRESGRYQWVRETLMNALEADAGRVEFGVEWQAVETHGVYRRVISDDGTGMDADELVQFFNTFGGGGKPIGGVHENYGVGSKTSLLPWNHHGLVVVSWVDGEGSLIWVQRDADTGEYGLRLFEASDDDGNISLEAVVAPFDDPESGCDWSTVGPDWVRPHGTVIVLLGQGARADTVMGDPSRDEADIKGLSSYLNRRVWKVPPGVTVTVDELRSSERSAWPRSAAEAHGPQPPKGRDDRRTNARTIRGARHYVEYTSRAARNGGLAASGAVALPDGSDVHWFLWDGERPAVGSYAAIGGYIGALYRNELYDVTSHLSTYRSFGVSESAVRSRLTLIVEPPPFSDDSGRGVYPRTDRNALLLKGVKDAGASLPMADWGREFADRMPPALLKAIQEARVGQSGTIREDKWRERLADRFGSRWRITKRRVATAGPTTVHAGQPGTPPRPVTKARRKAGGRRGGSGGRSGGASLGTSPGTRRARVTKVAGGLPDFRAAEGSEFTAGILAAWQPSAPGHDNGVVLLNVDHPVLVAEIEHWQAQYPDHLADQVREEVVETYGQTAVAKIAHSEHLKGLLPSETVETLLRSDEALTMALLGLIGEEAILGPRLGATLGRRRVAS